MKTNSEYKAPHKGHLVESVAGIVLAAGKSSRMGSTKQLLPFRGRTLLVHSLSQACHSNLAEVILVLGHQYEVIEKNVNSSLCHDKLRIVENKNYSKGLSTSIVAGLDVVENRYNHVMFLLADMPGVGTEMINLLMVRYLDSGLPVGAVSSGGKPVHPVIFNACLFPEIKQMTGDVGARSILKANCTRTCMVEPLEEYDSRDTDTPEDYRKLLTL